MSGGNPPTKPSDVSLSGNKLTISLSAIVASVWAGIWGFDWAATHLDGGALFIAILIGLGLGAWLTYYLVKKAFEETHTLEELYYLALAEAIKQGKDPSTVPPPVVILKNQ